MSLYLGFVFTEVEIMAKGVENTGLASCHSPVPAQKHPSARCRILDLCASLFRPFLPFTGDIKALALLAYFYLTEVSDHFLLIVLFSAAGWFHFRSCVPAAPLLSESCVQWAVHQRFLLRAHAVFRVVFCPLQHRKLQIYLAVR